MPQTIHGPNTLIRLPDRILTRLQNGVAEVTRRYACRTSVASTFRSQFAVGATLPGESGFTIKYKYIERKREDGFTEFEVTGVGVDPTAGGTSTSGLKAQDDRTVEVFPSGLVRVDRSYVCPTASEATFRPLLLKGNPPPQDDLAPAIDGLYIFPDPRETRRDDGFTVFSVSSYGRINTEGLLRQSTTVIDLGIISVPLSNSPFGSTVDNPYTFTVVTKIQTFVVPYAFDIKSVNLNQYRTFFGYLTGGGYYMQQTAIINGSIFISPFAARPSTSSPPVVTTTNYGFWDEVTIDYGF